MSIDTMKWPLWLRIVLLAGALALAIGIGLFGYRYYKYPVTLTVAVGSADGEAAKTMSAIASRLASTDAPVRLRVIDAGTVLDSAKAFSMGNVDLAVVRGDVGDLSQAQAVVFIAHVVALLVAPPGSPVTAIEDLKGRTIGVIGADANAGIVDVLKKTYNLVQAKVQFRSVTAADARQALQSKEIGALLVVIPLTEKYLSQVRALFPQSAKKFPVLIPIDSAGAIAETNRAYESFDVPKGTLHGAPAVPDDDLTTLQTSLYLVANKKLSSDVASNLAEALMKARRELLGELPVLAKISAPDTDADAFLPVHPGAAAFFNGERQSFMEKYSDAFYAIPMILGALATGFAAAWNFLGIGPEPKQGPLDTLYALARKVRKAADETELSQIEDEIDDVLESERDKAASGDDNAVDAATLNVAAHRLENLIHDRRILLTGKPAGAPAA